jgi:uncharacterized membrane protein
MDFFPPAWLVTSLTWFQTTTKFPEFINAHGWIWAASETVHFMGICLLMGTIGAFDLRLLGMAKNLPIGPLQRLIPWGVLGFGICLATGMLFVLGNYWSANAYFNNMAFKWKMGLILLAGVNVLIFTLTKMDRAVAVVGSGGSAPIGAKVIAGTSLALWIGVIFWGRFLPILGDAF